MKAQDKGDQQWEGHWEKGTLGIKLPFVPPRWETTPSCCTFQQVSVLAKGTL